MSLQAGHKLAHYEIIEPIGKGGMGEVYRAKDSKLGRDVAIKVLPDEFAENEERLARFKREAKVLASLNHPGIAAIHGLEESEGTHYLVLELVPGETLAERISRGPIPVEEALEIANQIAEALDAAHEKNIVHRDLKPANLKITPEGQVKVLDFGLAKAYEPEGTNIDLSDSPTLARQDTRDGTILGTPAYMSPEQARGKRVDKRTDIWAFGCCLFEMLCEKSAFARDTLSDTLSAVLRDEPEWDALPETLPANIEPLLRHCLVKDPKQRLRDIGDALAVWTGTFWGTREQAQPHQKWLPITLGIGLLAAVAFLLYLLFVPSSVDTAAVSRFVITLPPEQRLSGRSSDAIVLSPDGSRLVYVAEVDGVSRLYLRELDTFAAQPIAKTEGAVAPFFSPDGEAVGFFVGEELRQVGLASGVVTLICTAPSRVVEAHASWGSRGEIVFAFDRFRGLFRVDASGGEPQRLSTPKYENGERGLRRPHLLPNGDVMVSVDTEAGFRPAILSRATGELRALVGVDTTGLDNRYIESGHLVYGDSGTLFAVPVVPGSLDATGSPVPVATSVRKSLVADFAHFSVGGGHLAYLGGVEEARVVTVDRDGRATPLFDQTDDYRYLSLSPDGRRLALTLRRNVGFEVWVYELDRGTRTRLTTAGSVFFPVWTPDGASVTFTNTTDIVVTAADGSGEPESLLTSGRPLSSHWSPDGETLLFDDMDPDTGGYDINTWRDGVVKPLITGPFHESIPRLSPNGHWLAYMSDESGRWEIYAQAFPGPGEKWTLSTQGGTEPVWSRDGTELFYRSGDRMMVVSFETEPAFRPRSTRMLFEGEFESNPGGYPDYDVSLDGSRFYMIERDAGELNEIHVVLNWFEELKRLAPTDN